MCYIVTEVKKGKLIKIKGEWFVSYVVDSSDDSKSIKYIKINNFQEDKEFDIDNKLSEKYKISTTELNSKEVFCLDIMNDIINEHYAILI